MTGNDVLLMAIQEAGGDVADLPFWAGCREGRFLLHRCRICERWYWPASRCLQHGDQDMAWLDASGRGTIHTYTVMHHAYTPAMREKTPFAVAVVKLDEGPFFHTNILGCAAGDVHVGMTVEGVIEPAGQGLTLPMFRPAP